MRQNTVPHRPEIKEINFKLLTEMERKVNDLGLKQ